MFERIEADASQFPGGVVAKSVRDKAVRRLVEGDGDDEGDDPDRDVVEGDVQLVGPPGSKDEGKASTDRPSDGVKALFQVRRSRILKRRNDPAGLLRGACHRARIRATRWLPMTGEGHYYVAPPPEMS